MNAVNSYGQGSKSWEEVARNAMADRADLLRENTELKNFSAGLELNLAAVIQRAEAAERELADAEALRALAAWIRNVRGNYVGLIATDGKLWRVDVCTCIRIDPKSGEGATLAAAIMDALGKANANRAA